MAITLEEMRAGRIDPNTLDPESRAAIGEQLRAEQQAAVAAEAAASRKTHASAERQRGLNETVGPQPQRPVKSADTGRFAGPITDTVDPAARETVTANRAADVETATGLDRNATPQFQEISPEANAAAARDRSRGPGSEATTRRTSAGGTGFTESQLPDLESKPGIVERGLRAVGATGAADAREAARLAERAPLEPATSRPAGGELDVEDRAMSSAQQKKVDSLNKNIATAQERKRRAQSTINKSKNPAAVTAAKEAIKAADKDIAAATNRAATVQAEARTPTPAGDVVDTAKRVKADPVGAADDVANKTREVFDDAASTVKDSAKNPEGKLNRIAEKVKEVATAGVQKAKDLKGRIAPSKSASKEATTLANRMKTNTKRVVKLGLGVELANAADDFGVRVSQVGFEQAADEVADGAVQGMSDMMTRINQDENFNERDGLGKAAQSGIELQNALVDMVKGMATTFGADVPQKLHDLGADLADSIGVPFTDLRFRRGTGFNYEQYVKPEGFSGFEGRTFREGIDAAPFELGTTVGEGLPAEAAAPSPGSPEFRGAADPGALPGRPGERFDPLGSQALPEVTTEPFLEPGAGEGQFNVGLRGNIDAGGATGGPSGFAQRVEESRRSGAYEPVSQARRDEAQADLGRIKRGTSAIRDLAASRMGVPTQYLDAVRSGAMTPREANLAQAKQNATGNAGGITAAEAQDFQIKAQQESRAGQEFQQKMTDSAIERFQAVGTEVAASFGDGLTEGEREQVSANFTTFAAGWLPEGQDPATLTSTDLQIVKGQYMLATALADQGEGWVRALNPFAPDITTDTLFQRGENILRTMKKQGEWFDIGNDNLRFEGLDSAGEPVTLTIETEDLPAQAQNMVRQFRDELRRERGLR